MNTKSSSFEVVTSDGDIMPPFIFLHGLKLNMVTHIKCMGWSCSGSRGWLLENNTSHNRFLRYVMQENPVLVVREFLQPHYNPLDYYEWSTVERKTKKTLYSPKDELKARIMTAFTNLNKQTVGKACKSRLEAVVKVNEDLLE